MKHGWWTALGILALVPAYDPGRAAADNGSPDGPHAVNCYNEALGTVRETLPADCRGKVVDDAEAEAIRQKRREYIKGVVSTPPAIDLEGKHLAGSGSGFFVGADGSLITDRDVVDRCVIVSVAPSFGAMVSATVVGADEATDLALLRADLAPPGVASLVEGEGSGNRSPAYVIGYPAVGALTTTPVVTAVEILSWQQLVQGLPTIVIRGEVRLGNSGGPLLDSAGGVIGAVFAKADTASINQSPGLGAQNIGLAVPSEALQSFLDAQGVDYQVGLQRSPQPADRILLDARPFVAQVGCWQ